MLGRNLLKGPMGLSTAVNTFPFSALKPFSHRLKSALKKLLACPFNEKNISFLVQLRAFFSTDMCLCATPLKAFFNEKYVIFIYSENMKYLLNIDQKQGLQSTPIKI